MKKVVLKLDVHDEKCKQKAFKMISTLDGLVSVSMNMKDKELTLTGDIDPVIFVIKLRKCFPNTEIISVGPTKESEPKKDEPKGQAQLMNGFVQGYYNHPPHPSVHYYAKSVEENPNACVIC